MTSPPRLWAIPDSRGKRVRLVRANEYTSGNLSSSDLPKTEFKQIQHDSSGDDRWGRSAIQILILVIAVAGIGECLLQLQRHHWRSAATDASGSLLAVATAYFFGRYYSFGSNPARLCTIMLQRGRCPSCGYNIADVPPDLSDGCTVCPECGAAWKLPGTPPVEQTSSA